ncbi:hypothetical protein [Streptomyces prasinus]|uniref:hypothetical protein n=1 Tax=Streptomyces prasinus TaxID=67345 RepID=UPI0036AF5D8D
MWAKFVEDGERNIRDSTPKEPSARARMVTERLRVMDEAQTRAGSGGKRRGGRNASATPPARPEGWRTGPAPQDVNGRDLGRRGRWSVVGVLVADGRVRLLVVKSEIFDDDCRNGDGVIRPQFFTGRPDGPTPTGAARDPCDRSKGVREADQGCGIASRT